MSACTTRAVAASAEVAKRSERVAADGDGVT
jgi:hypothetical protein